MSSIFGETLTFGQENGSAVKLVVYGDEFYARYETEDGYTVVYDADVGSYCYALVINGEFVSSGVTISESPPARVRRHLRESEEVRNAKFNKRHALMIPPPQPVALHDTLRTLGPNNGLLEGRRVSEGSVRGLAVLVQFQDVKSTVSAAEVSEMLNGRGYTENGNFCSVRDYYQMISSGKLDYFNEVVGPITLKQNRMYYAQNLLVEEALNAVVDMGIDLSRFDSRREGIIDALGFLYAGQTQYLDWLWPHNHVINLRYGNIRTYFYMISSLGRSKTDLSIGTFCHESGHMLCRFPDLYDYGGRDGDFEKSAGLGRYCLMSSGNHNNGGKTPSPVCAYLRDLVGWCENKVVINQPDEYEVVCGDYGTILVYETGKINEYFIVENRCRLGLNEGIPASGLAVYHCDTLGSNEWQGGTATKHYQCGLLQADGHLDLENNRNTGDDKDLFKRVDGVALTHNTNPHSNMWDGSESGLIISQVTEPAEVISFMAGGEPSSLDVFGEAAAGLKVPDYDPNGARSSITISEAGNVRTIEVKVDITHTYIGDLSVVLIAPSGQRATLHNRGGGGQDNLITSYDSASNADLKSMIGQPVKGDWTLWVSDHARRDVGKLNKWSIGMGLEAKVRTIQEESATKLPIPDNDPTGVSSSISVTVDGTVQKVAVDVDITHTYIGDLRVELFSPEGRQAILHNRTGGGQDDLVKTYDQNSSADIAAFAGQPTRGNWILRVTDLAGRDVGTLNRWGLKIGY